MALDKGGSVCARSGGWRSGQLLKGSSESCLPAEPLTLDTKRGNGGAGGRTRVVGGGEARVPDAMSCMRAKLRERGRGKGERSGV